MAKNLHGPFPPALIALVVMLAAVAGSPAPAGAIEARPPGDVDPLDLPRVSRLAPDQVDGRRVWSIRGVITAVAAETMAVQHGGDACWVRHIKAEVETEGALASDAALMVGALVEADGTMQRGGYAPTLAAERIHVLGSAPLPEPLSPDSMRIFSGADNGLRVAVEGVVQGVRGDRGAWRLVMAVDSGRLAAELAGDAFPERPANLVDARVRVVGVARAVANTRGEFVAPIVLVARAEDLVVMTPRPEATWSGPLLPLGNVARFERRKRPGHRVQTEGIVTHVADKSQLVLQEGIDGLRVDTARQSRAMPGERVRVSGFIDTSDGGSRLVEAIVSRTGDAAVPAPEPITPSRALAINRSAAKNGRPARPGTYDGCLVRFPARLVAIEREPGGVRFALDDGESLVEATLAGEPGDAAWLAENSRLKVTGVLMLEHDRVEANDGSRTPAVRRATLLVRSPADIVLVAAPPWWTSEWMLAAVAVLVAVLGAALVWVVLLRRQVARQSRRLAVEMSGRVATALEYQVTLRERAHLAANLHDTVLQTLAGIGYQIKACRLDAERRGQGGAPRLTAAETMVAECVGKLRGTLWTLRTLPDGDRGFRASLADLVARLGEGRAAPIKLETSGDLDAINAAVAGQLLLVLQEATANALTHGRPGRVTVTVAVNDLGDIEVVVRDDGCGFDPDAHEGPGQGHFGLQGLRDRAARVGGSLAITSRPGAGTEVTLRVPAGRRAPVDTLPHVMEAADA